MPDGTPIPALIPLKDRERPPKKDDLHPGYPNFIHGKPGEPPLQPPCGVLDKDGNVTVYPTPLEEANFVQNAAPGALYTDTCPCHTVGECERCHEEENLCEKSDCESDLECEEIGEEKKDCSSCCFPKQCSKVKVFEIALVQAKITYNRYGWHDPEGRFFVLKEELERHGGLESYIRKVENEEIPVEPLVIRANAGDCIELHTTNLLPEFLEANAFQLRTMTDIVGHHVHLVKFDTIVADGAANGWNNIAGARKYETLIERFFADEELRTVFFHDHLFANSHQQHGMFGAIIIEEAGATFHNIRDGKELRFGTKAVIRRRDGTSFREFALFVHDFALLFDKEGKPLDEPHTPSQRVSLNPQFLRYDPVQDSGINVGYNCREQTVGIGERKGYLWYADQEYGACILQSFGDMRNHRYHGLFGAVIVEPAGAAWYRNFTKKIDPFAEQAVITALGVESFREYAVFIQNGIRLLDAQENLIQTAAAESGEPVDAEDTGEKGYNYHSERFANRLKKDPRVWKVFSSKIHGDPSTPIWKAYSGDRVIFRTMMPADKPRNVSFALHGHLWKEQPRDAFSREIPLQGAVSIGNRFDMEPKGGAGCPGDYLYRSGSFGWDVESGMWGIFRVMKRSVGSRCKGFCGKLLGCMRCKK